MTMLRQKKKYQLDVQMRRMNWTKVYYYSHLLSLLNHHFFKHSPTHTHTYNSIFYSHTHTHTLTHYTHTNTHKLQVQPVMLKPDSFWARVNEESFASQDLFQDIEKTFATGRGQWWEPSLVCIINNVWTIYILYVQDWDLYFSLLLTHQISLFLISSHTLFMLSLSLSLFLSHTHTHTPSLSLSLSLSLFLYLSISRSLSLSLSHPPARGGLEVEERPRFTAPKIKELKVIDGKTAQNICETHKIFTEYTSILHDHHCHLLCVSLETTN